MSKEKEITRKFSKQITVASLAAFFGIAGVGLLIGNQHTAAIVDALGPWVVAMLIIYMGIGHLDFRTAKGLPGFFTDVLTLAFTRKKPESEGEK